MRMQAKSTFLLKSLFAIPRPVGLRSCDWVPTQSHPLRYPKPGVGRRRGWAPSSDRVLSFGEQYSPKRKNTGASAGVSERSPSSLARMETSDRRPGDRADRAAGACPARGRAGSCPGDGRRPAAADPGSCHPGSAASGSASGSGSTLLVSVCTTSGKCSTVGV